MRNLKTQEFLHVESLIIPEDFASTKVAAVRRRMWRTRQAHRARETWLDEVWRAAGQEPLQRREAERNAVTHKWTLRRRTDKRLGREFPAEGDSTCFTSCLLRIRLLRGETLQAWQIYKALRSAIQRRGYDPDIPWKHREAARRKGGEDDEEGVTRARMEHFVEELRAMIPGREDCQLPCYFDAWKMGLWDPAAPDTFRERIDCRAQSTRDQVVPRWLVEHEVRLLIEAAGRQIPALVGQADFVLWGPARRPYASHDPALRKALNLRQGGVGDWQGVVGQKIPRFDNRIIEKCSLIPRLNVCKIKTDDKGRPLDASRIAFEATFLMKLKNMRIQRRPGEQGGLTVEEIRAIFNNPKITGYKVTEAQWRRLCVGFGVHPLPGSEEVAAPRGGGRSRFCRPALEIIKRLVLSGQSPVEFHEAEVTRLGGNVDPLRGLVATDLGFLLKMGATWEKLYLPNERLDAVVRLANSPAEAIGAIIGSQNDPVVRHRLTVFAERLKTLHADYGVPEEIVLEFVRKDFMGREARAKYERFIKDRAAARIRAREDAAKVGATERSAALKLELLREQGGICLYTGAGLLETKLDAYEIDHIVPRSKGGPDAVVNYTLTTHAANHEKDNRTPFEWLSATAGWDAYVQRVRARRTTLRGKKTRLLLEADAPQLAERLTALAETAWIAKLSQSIVDAFFGWSNGVDPTSGRRRVRVVNGGLTARIRRKYGLNRLLHPEVADEEEAEKKNRDDDRHHALDAMVINFLPQWTRDAAKEHFFRLPDGVTRETFRQVLETVTPRNLCLEKPALADTIYGARGAADRRVIVQRAVVLDLGYRSINPSKSIYDADYAIKQCKSIRDEHIRGLLLEFLEQDPPEEGWKQFCESLCLRRRDGSLGPRVKVVTLNCGDATEFVDLSKDGTGAWRKAKKAHKGQLVFRQADGRIRVRPIYAFESVRVVQSEESAGSDELVGFFQSLCSVSLDHFVAHPKTPLVPGRYTLNTIRKDGFAVVTDSRGKKSQPISLVKLLASGFRRLKS